MVRLNLYNRELFCGAQAILWELEDMGISPLPSLRTINRILARNELTHRRTGRYVPKGTKYPVLPSSSPNETHQADLVGPCYLKGPIRFYSFNVVDELLSNLVYGPSGGVPVWLVRYTLSVLENYSSNDFPKKFIAPESSPPLFC